MCACPIMTHSINGEVFSLQGTACNLFQLLQTTTKNHQTVNGLTLDIVVNKVEISE